METPSGAPSRRDQAGLMSRHQESTKASVTVIDRSRSMTRKRKGRRMCQLTSISRQMRELPLVTTQHSGFLAQSH